MIINSSQWSAFSEGKSILYAAHCKPNSIKPIDCNAPTAFAWVLYHQQTQEITAARDYLGLEPFYYCYHNKTFVFGSTVSDVLKKLPNMPALNTSRLLEECFHNGKMLMTRYSNETHYQGVFRLDPGSKLHIQKGQLRVETYWSFDSGAPIIHYANDRDYIEHFGELFDEIVLEQIEGYDKLAAEYSGGLDSTAVITACHNHQIKLPLYCHMAGDSKDSGDFSFAECVINHFNLTDVHYIDASNFDPRIELPKLAEIFAGVPPYLFSIMANNVYQAMSDHGIKRVLSGFGGDQCVSSHASPKLFYAELLRQKQYRKAWQECVQAKPDVARVNHVLQLLRYSYPKLSSMLEKVGDVKRMVLTYLQASASDARPIVHRYPNYASLREMHVDLLQGALCHEVRMRVEYTAVLGKAMGFSMAYPLLHPKLIDFSLRLPLLQSRRNGEGRYLIRQYLAQYVPEKNYKQEKRKGAHIMPAVMQKCKDYEASGALDHALAQLPFSRSIEKASTPHCQLRHKLYANMLELLSKSV